MNHIQHPHIRQRRPYVIALDTGAVILGNMKKTHIIPLTFTLALLACLLSGCRGKNCNKAANFTRDGQHTQITKIELCSNRKSYDWDDVVHIRFTVTNVWDQPLLLTDEERPVVDVCTEGDGYGERCWSDEQGPSPSLTRLLLEPGDSYTIEWDWQSDGGGDVRIEGYWLRPDGIFGHVPIVIVYGSGEALRPFDF